MKDHYRRPRAAALLALYDMGVAAVTDGTVNPFEPPSERGDEIRAHLWRQGFEDETEAAGINDLI